MRPVALVTGASRGIGRAVALALAVDHDLVLTSTSAQGTRAVAKACAALGAEVLEQPWEAASRASADRLVQKLEKRFGRCDVLVNNAGIVVRRTLAAMSDDDFDRVLGVNLSGPFYLCRRLVPGMVKRKRGRVINVSSISATLGSPGATGYAASKWGLDGFTKSLAEELRGTGVLALSVLPGSVDTDMLKGSRFEAQMSADDVAGVVRFLATQAPEAMLGSRVEMFG